MQQKRKQVPDKFSSTMISHKNNNVNAIFVFSPFCILYVTSYKFLLAICLDE